MSQQLKSTQRDELTLYEMLLMFCREWRVFVGVLCVLVISFSAVFAYKELYGAGQEKRINLISLGGYTRSMEQLGYVDLMPTSLKNLVGVSTQEKNDKKSDFTPFLKAGYIEHKVLEEFRGLVRRPGEKVGSIEILPADKDFVAIENARKNHTVGPYRPDATLKLVADSSTPHLQQKIQQIVSYIRQEESLSLARFLKRSRENLAFNEQEMKSVDKEIARDRSVLSNYTAVRVHDVDSAQIVSTELGFLTNFTNLRKERFSLLAQNNLLKQGLDSAQPAGLFLSYRELPKDSGFSLKTLAMALFASLFIAVFCAFLTAVMRQQAQAYRLAGEQHG